MPNLSSKSSNLFLVVTSLTGTDREEVLEQTKKLPPSMPPKSSPDYKTFVDNFINSPANVMTTVASYLQQKAAWDISSETNYQQYLNLYNNAPFVSGVGSGTNPISGTFNNIPDLLSEIFVDAKIPSSKQATIEEGFSLKTWFERDFEEAPKSLTIISQNLEANDGNLLLAYTKATFTITYFPPEKNTFRQSITKHKPKPLYKLEGNASHVSLSIRQPSFFVQNQSFFVSLGLFVSVTDWIEANSTPKPTSL